MFPPDKCTKKERAGKKREINLRQNSLFFQVRRKSFFVGVLFFWGESKCLLCKFCGKEKEGANLISPFLERRRRMPAAIFPRSGAFRQNAKKNCCAV